MDLTADMSLPPASLLARIKGQDRAIGFLQQAIESKRLPQTMLFSGPHGVGKSRVALGVAQALACETSSRGCGTCPSCIRIEKRQSEALIELEPAGAQYKIEQMRNLIKDLSLRTGGKARTVIVKDAQLLNPQSANSLLKTLEEPPESTFFILLSPSATGVLPTIRSRSQIVSFVALSREVMAEICRDEKIAAQPWQIEAAHGRMDHVIALQQEDVGSLRKAALDFWSHGDSQTLLSNVTTRDSALWVSRFWQEFVRDALFHQLGISPLIHQDYADSILHFSRLPAERLGAMSETLQRLERDIQGNADYGLAFENAIRNDLYA